MILASFKVNELNLKIINYVFESKIKLFIKIYSLFWLYQYPNVKIKFLKIRRKIKIKEIDKIFNWDYLHEKQIYRNN